MGSIRERFETVYAALAFIERNAVQEALPMLEELSSKPLRRTRRAGKTVAQTARPGLRAE